MFLPYLDPMLLCYSEHNLRPMDPSSKALNTGYRERGNLTLQAPTNYQSVQISNMFGFWLQQKHTLDLPFGPEPSNIACLDLVGICLCSPITNVVHKEANKFQSSPITSKKCHTLCLPSAYPLILTHVDS